MPELQQRRRTSTKVAQLAFKKDRLRTSRSPKITRVWERERESSSQKRLCDNESRKNRVHPIQERLQTDPVKKAEAPHQYVQMTLASDFIDQPGQDARSRHFVKSDSSCPKRHRRGCRVLQASQRYPRLSRNPKFARNQFVQCLRQSLLRRSPHIAGTHHSINGFLVAPTMVMPKACKAL